MPRVAKRDCPLIGGLHAALARAKVCIGTPFKSVTEPGTEGAVVDRATNLEQQISASPRPSHLLGLVHAPVDQEVRGVPSVIDVPTRSSARNRLA